MKIPEVKVTNTEQHLNAVWEALKELGRLYLVSVVPLIIGVILTGINTETGAININWMIVRAVFLFQSLTFILRAVDKYKHILNKSLNPKGLEGKSAGIIPF